MAKIRELVKELADARAEYHEKSAGLTAAQTAEATAAIKKMNQAVTDTITAGAEACPDCDNKPHGIFHDGTPKPFEIGCLNCRFLKTEAGDTVRVPDGASAGMLSQDEAGNVTVGAIIDGVLVKGTHLFTHRVRDVMLDDVIDRWNKGDYDPPREPGTVVMTKRDATGAVTEQKTAKVQLPKSRRS